MTDTTQILPKLRFPEFENDGEWKVVKLGDIAQFFKGKGISKAEVSNTGTIPCIRYGELYTYYKEVVRDIKSYTNIPTDNLVLSKANDVIIPSSGETKEDISTASCIIEDGIALGGDINIIRSSANGIFLSYYLNNAKKNDIAKIAQGISIIHLYNEQLQNLSIALPSLPEQQKIAAFLTSLDEQISAHTKKLEALKAHKKGLMQQLFPANGEKTPKLRFPEFKNAGEWKEVKISDALRADSSTIQLNKLQFVLTGYPVYGADGIIGNIATFQHSDKYISVVKDGSGVGRVNICRAKSSTLSTLTCLKPKTEQYNLGFLFYTLQTFNWAMFVMGSGIPHIYYSDFKNTLISIPSLPEQQKIATFLTSIDEMIQAQDDKIRKLKIYKNGLMQQLFPQK